ncbi:Peptidoglycan/LPS O-acetylase OafA/YrhL, contains acyltransferase and SGNH-hydrolase domains [Butyrivibrio sp. ob235]|uniref:acyltransferase family protein n=1 Tax=Butyrivibrio sp. ob235 TaxID=1761780 RepID=UPI0008B7DF7E|nr:Peptidoglycan/LPS O-acetylase OafA/YrhL, contains acyltransferase and SGNH-hydrolase domains [Butyrivibrio sp. ob235]
MEYLFLYIFILLILIPGIKFEREGINEIVLIQKNVNKLRGIFAILIIFTHCTLAYGNLPTILMPLRKVSTFCVGFFFCLSGYGLALSYGSKKDYLKGFLVRKISKIFCAAVLSRIVTEIMLLITIGEKMSIKSLFKDMNWYIYALLGLYILYYVIYKFSRNSRTKALGIWLVVIFMTSIIMELCKISSLPIGRSYYISEWAFPIGITIYEYRDKIKHVFLKYNVWVVGGMLLMLVLTFIMSLRATDYSIMDLISHNLMLIPFYFFVMLICRYFTFDNGILRFLSKISFEIYLYQFGFLILFKNRLKSIGISYFWLTLILTVVLAWMIRLISGKVRDYVSISRMK